MDSFYGRAWRANIVEVFIDYVRSVLLLYPSTSFSQALRHVWLKQPKFLFQRLTKVFIKLYC